jgi:hypothetical protein
MESKRFKLGISARYRYRCHKEPVSSKSGFWLRGAGAVNLRPSISAGAPVNYPRCEDRKKKLRFRFRRSVAE